MDNPSMWTVTVAGAIAPIAWKWGQAKAAEWIADEFVELAHKALDAGDADVDAWVKATIALIDKKTDKALQGKDRLLAMSAYVCQRVPLLKNSQEDVVVLLEKILLAVEAKGKELEGPEPPK